MPSEGLAPKCPDPQVHKHSVDYARLLLLGRDLLVALGEDPDRPGLVDTPRRFASMWREFIEYDPGKTETAFDCVTSGDVDQMVVVAGMRVWSMCEHHLLPFWCDVSIGYIARGQVLGLSKFARIAHQFAHRLQLQEQLGAQIAAEVTRVTGSPDVGVILSGEHTCMTMRGIRTPGLMRSSTLCGVFRSAAVRAEFLTLAGVG